MYFDIFSVKNHSECTLSVYHSIWSNSFSFMWLLCVSFQPLIPVCMYYYWSRCYCNQNCFHIEIFTYSMTFCCNFYIHNRQSVLKWQLVFVTAGTSTEVTTSMCDTMNMYWSDNLCLWHHEHVLKWRLLCVTPWTCTEVTTCVCDTMNMY